MSIKTFIKSHAVLATTLGIFVIIAMIIAGRVASRGAVTDTSLSNVKKVDLVAASSFRGDVSRVAADGTVESVAQADLRSQVSAPVASVNVAIGDSVSQGQTITVLQNADIRAQLDQARAALVVARGQYSTGGLSLDSVRTSAIEKIRSSYVSADEAVRVQLDQFLYNESGGNQSLYSYITERELADRIRDLRIDLTVSMREWKKLNDTLSSESSYTDIAKAMTLSRTNLQTVSDLLNAVSDGLNDAIQSFPASESYDTLQGWRATVTAARSSIIATTASLTASEAALTDAQSTYLSPAPAQVSIAEAGVKNLEAQLAKTIITSPISGKIAALPLRVGELASPGALMATVVGGGGLQIKAFASGEDLTRIKPGARVLVQNSINATVTSVAPSVSQVNKKVEVTIAVPNSAQSGLIIGQSVTVSIEAAQQVTTSESRSYILPIQNVKIVPGNAYVFTVDAESKIVSHPVTLGRIQGDFIEVTTGLTDDMQIVTPVYELEAGQEVMVR